MPALTLVLTLRHGLLIVFVFETEFSVFIYYSFMISIYLGDWRRLEIWGCLSVALWLFVTPGKARADFRSGNTGSNPVRDAI
jgi:hypothetical protein